MLSSRGSGFGVVSMGLVCSCSFVVLMKRLIGTIRPVTGETETSVMYCLSPLSSTQERVSSSPSM